MIEASDALELMAEFGRPERGQGSTAWDRLNGLVVAGSGSNIDIQLDNLLVSLEKVEKGLVIAEQIDPDDEISIGSCVDDLSFESRGDLVSNRF